MGSDMCGVMHEKRTALPAPSPAVLTASPSVSIVAGLISSGNREAPSPWVRDAAAARRRRVRHQAEAPVALGGRVDVMSAPRANKSRLDGGRGVSLSRGGGDGETGEEQSSVGYKASPPTWVLVLSEY